MVLAISAALSAIVTHFGEGLSKTFVAMVICGFSLSISAAQARDSAVRPAFIVASAAGATLNANLLEGGGADDTAVLQSVLDKSSTGRPVHLMIDGVAQVGGLNVSGNTTIECLPGGGLYLKDQANRDVIRNTHRSRGAITDENITIRGCLINGNRNNQLNVIQRDGSHESQEPDGTYVSGIQFLGVKNVNLSDLTLLNIRAFGVCIANAEHIRVRDVRVDNGSPPYNPSQSVAQQLELALRYIVTDGVHLIGPVHDAVLDGLTLHTGDDAVALNANDAGVDDMTVHNDMGPYITQGPITDVFVSNIVLDEAAFGIRLLSSNQRVDRVTVRGISGTVQNRVALLSHWTTPGSNGNFGSVLFSDINVKTIPVAPPKVLLASFKMSETDMAKIEQENFPLFSLNASIENLCLRNVLIDVSDSRSLIQAGPDAVIQSLSADLSVQDPELQAIPLQLEPGARIERLNWALEWHGRDLNVGKRPILNRGGEVQQLHWTHTPPMFVEARLDERDMRSINAEFSQVVKSNDLRTGVKIRVNNVPVRIREAIPTDSSVIYRISGPLQPTDSVTWAYDNRIGAIANLDGDQMASVGEKPVVTRPISMGFKPNGVERPLGVNSKTLQ